MLGAPPPFPSPCPSPCPSPSPSPKRYPSPSDLLSMPFYRPSASITPSPTPIPLVPFSVLGSLPIFFCPITLGCWSVSRMPKLVETLLQVKQRQTRELKAKARTQARCAELLGGTHQESSRHHNTPEPVSICLCCICRTANQSPSVSDGANHIFDDDEGSSSEADGDIHRPLKEWPLCINVSCIVLLILCAGNCLLS